LQDIPFDEHRGVIPNAGGRALDETGEEVPGIYATGWIKRGPQGLIGATKSDAMETVQNLLNGQSGWWSPAEPGPQAIVDLLTERGIRFTEVNGWHNLDEHEKALGEAAGRERIKVVPRDEMLDISLQGPLAPQGPPIAPQG